MGLYETMSSYFFLERLTMKYEMGIRVFKFALSGAVGIGTGKIAAAVIKNNIEPEKLIDKVTVAAAAWAIGGLAATQTKKYTNDSIDEIVTTVTDLVHGIKVAGKLSRINDGTSTFDDEGLEESDFVYDVDAKKYRLKPDDVEGETVN
jgi:recombinational DNA repair protein RecR